MVTTKLITTEKLAKAIRKNIVISTTEAGSGHPSSSLSATDIMATLFFNGFFKADLNNVNNPNNDRLIFSKGHASPLLYALYAAAGKVSKDELLSLRKFGSPLEGHPTKAFTYTEAATGSLGQGLSIGVGIALNAKYIDKLSYKTYILLGDSEMAEGSNYEAMEIAANYKLNNLIAIIDVNRLGQRGETLYGHNTSVYKKKAEAFGWQPIVIDGHSIKEIIEAFEKADKSKKPIMIIAKTIKGKGVSFIENKDGWHGKPVPKDQLQEALDSIGDIDETIVGEVALPSKEQPSFPEIKEKINIDFSKPLATRKVYGKALVNCFVEHSNIVVLDAEVSNSTFSKDFKEIYPERFFEMFIAEQNMVGTALGFSTRGKIPFVSTFAAFLTRAADQIRMCQYSDANITFVGSHAGVSIGEDGSSQMALEDISLFRAIHESIVLYPSDAHSCVKLVEQAVNHYGIKYIRTSRPSTPAIYSDKEEFPIGKSKVLKQSKKDVVTLVSAGITLHEALNAYEQLKKEGINVRVVDLYSVKPIDVECLKWCKKETQAIITIEDHYPEGGISDAVRTIVGNIYSLAVRKLAKSGTKDELLSYEEINAEAIIKKVKEIIQ